MYSNNSIIPLQDIGPPLLVYNASVYCYTTHSPCCTTTNEGSWFLPRGTDLNFHDNYVAHFPATQTVNLYRPTSSYISGMFYCRILDGIARFATLYVGIYQQGLGEYSVLIFDDRTQIFTNPRNILEMKQLQ